jgi:hypothetical protein
MKKTKLVSLVILSVFMFSMYGTGSALAAGPFDQVQSAALGDNKFYMPVEVVLSAQVYSTPYNGTVEYEIFSTYEDSRHESFDNVMEDIGVVSSTTAYTATTGTYSGESSTAKGDVEVAESAVPVSQRASWKQFVIADNMNASFIATLVGDKLTAESELINYTISSVYARLPVPHQAPDADGLGDWVSDGIKWALGGWLDFENELKAYRLIVGTQALNLFDAVLKEDKKGTLNTNTPDYLQFDITTEATTGSINDLIEKGIHSYSVASTDRAQRIMLAGIVVAFFVIALPLMFTIFIWVKRRSMRAASEANKIVPIKKYYNTLKREIKK